jgi:hypothetical protein
MTRQQTESTDLIFKTFKKIIHRVTQSLESTTKPNLQIVTHLWSVMFSWWCSMGRIFWKYSSCHAWSTASFALTPALSP